MGAPVDTGALVEMDALVGMQARGLCGHELMSVAAGVSSWAFL